MNVTARQQMAETIAQRKLAGPDTPVLLMVSGGSDSTALAYLSAQMRDAGELGMLAMLHVNHHLRGADADADAAFAAALAETLGIPFFLCDIDVPAMVDAENGNMEAIARRERYAAARDALESLCAHVGIPAEEGRIFIAHTQDDRVESFYMRSIVGTGPGGFRSMTYANGQVARPLLDLSRAGLRDFLNGLENPVLDARNDARWCEDATNAETDRFRTFVRHKMVPLALEQNPRLLDTLSRTMNLIADEDDYLQECALKLRRQHVSWLSKEHHCATCPKLEGCNKKFRLVDAVQLEPGCPFGGFDPQRGCLLEPGFGLEHPVLQKRVLKGVLQDALGADERVENASINAILAGFAADGRPAGGYVANIQGNLAVSANKQGVRIEPMEEFRARRKM